VRRAGLIALAVACVLVQVSLLPALRPFGVVPNLALALVVLMGLEGTASMALAVAVVAGLAIDLASGANFGLWTGVLALAALVAGLLHRAGVELSGGLLAAAMVMVGTVLMTLVVLAGLVNTTSYWPVGWLVGRLLVELVLNLVLTFSLRPLVRWLLPAQSDMGMTG
jgi:cell shape-determining protein MreD